MMWFEVTGSQNTLWLRVALSCKIDPMPPGTRMLLTPNTCSDGHSAGRSVAVQRTPTHWHRGQRQGTSTSGNKQFPAPRWVEQGPDAVADAGRRRGRCVHGACQARAMRVENAKSARQEQSAWKATTARGTNTRGNKVRGNTVRDSDSQTRTHVQGHVLREGADVRPVARVEHGGGRVLVAVGKHRHTGVLPRGGEAAAEVRGGVYEYLRRGGGSVSLPIRNVGNGE